MSYKELQGVTKSYKELQGVTRSYKELQGVTRRYKKLQGVTRSSKHTWFKMWVMFADMSILISESRLLRKSITAPTSCFPSWSSFFLSVSSSSDEKLSYYGE